MRTQIYVLQLPGSGLFITATHYTAVCTESASCDLETLSGSSTVVFAHPYHDSQRKGDWETVISRLFDLCATPPDLLPPRWRVRDAWALEPQVYHGPAAAHRNEHAAADPLSVEEYASVLRYFVTSKLVQGRGIIAFGHSESTVAWTIACSGMTVPSMRAVIFVQEPTMSVVEYRHSSVSRTVTDPLAYRSMRATTRGAIGNRYAWKIWDERIFEAYLRHGLAEAHGAAASQDRELEPSTTEQEEEDDRCYTEAVTSTPQAIRHTTYTVHAVSVVSERAGSDVVRVALPTSAQLDVPTVRSLKRRSPRPSEQGDPLSSSSVARGGCGNLTVVQDNPDGVARAILGILRSCERASGRAVGKARL